MCFSVEDLQTVPLIAHNHVRFSPHSPTSNPTQNPWIDTHPVQDRAWLEQVVKEGVRDDFKAMTGIYSRLCTYLDRAATNPSPPLPGRGVPQSSEDATSTAQAPPAGGVSIATGVASDFVPPPPPPPPPTPVVPAALPAAETDAVLSTALSTFTAPPPSFPSPAEELTAAMPAVAAPAAGVAAGDDREGTVEEVKVLEEGVMNDLEVWVVFAWRSGYSCLFAGDVVWFSMLWGRRINRLVFR